MQCYENQRLNPIKIESHLWDAANLREEEDYAAWTDVNGVPILIPPNDLEFVVDTSPPERDGVLTVDAEGWIYARNFSIFQTVRVTQQHRRREKLSHFMTDRILAQVRRRRWIRQQAISDYQDLSTPAARQSSFHRIRSYSAVETTGDEILTPEEL